MPNLRLSFCFLTLFGLFSIKALSQDVHYSQRMAGDKQNNPTFINQFKGNWQAMTVYRNQWQSIGIPFTSSTLFLSKKILSKNPVWEYFGGISITNDKSGDGKLTGNRIALNLGVAYQLRENQFLIAINNSFVAKSIDEGALTFPSQYDRNIGGFNESLANGESFKSDQLSYYDLGFGLQWRRELTNNWKLSTGFSMLHLTEPKESFFDANNNKNRGYGIQLLAEKDFNKIKILPYLSFYRAKGASETLIGSALLFNTSAFGPIENIQPFLYLRTGIDRLNDALILGSKADIGNFQVGLSYDVNISELEVASNYQGAFEISLIYTGRSFELTKRRIPCERY